MQYPLLECDLQRFEIHAVDHCNLACIGCNHASPFLKKRSYEPDEFFPWIDLLLDNGATFHTIGISGGEPFLHPDINNFVKRMKHRYQCFINLFTNCFWMKDEASIDKYADALSRSDILAVSAYKPIVDKLGGWDRFQELLLKIRDRFEIKVSMFQKGVTDKFWQFDFYDEPRYVNEKTECHVKDCHQLRATGIFYRCTIGQAVEGHPGVTENFRNSKDLIYDLKTDPEHRSLAEWKTKWPLDACKFCGGSHDKGKPTEWVSDPSIRGMTQDEYTERVSKLKKRVFDEGTEVHPEGLFL